MAVVGEAEVRIVPDTRGFGQQVEKDIEDPVAKSAKRIGVALAAAFSVQQVGAFFKDAIDAASTAEEATSKVGVVFGESSQAVLDFADNATEAFGQSSNQALEATGTFGNLFRAIGLGEDQSAQFATALTGLASDLASFNDVEVDDALTALRSGLVGETEPLKRFGVNLNQATIEAKALEDGLISQGQELDAATKAQATYSLILEQTALAQGDFARTSDGLANSQRQLVAEFENAKVEIGQGLLPIASELVGTASEDLIPLITELAITTIPLLTDAFETFSPFLGITTDLLQSLLPLFDVLFGIIDDIPDPLKQIAATGFAANRVLGPLGLNFREVGFQARFAFEQISKNNLSETGTALTGVSGLATAAAGALVAGAAAWDISTQSARAYEEQLDRFAPQFDSIVAGQQDIDNAIEAGLFTELEELGDAATEALNGLGISLEEVADSIVAGGDALDPFRQAFAEFGLELGSIDVGELDNVGKTLFGIDLSFFDSFGQLTGEADANLNELVDSLNELPGVTGVTRDGLVDLIGGLQETDSIAQQLAQSTLDQAVAQGQLNAVALLTVSSQNELADGSTNYLAVLQELLPTLQELPAATEAPTDSTNDLEASVSGLTDTLIDTNEELEAYIDNILEAFEAELSADEAIAGTQAALEELTSAQLNLIAARDPETTREYRDAQLDLADAEAQLAAVNADAEATATERERAELAVVDARNAVAEASNRSAEAERELAEAEREALQAAVDGAQALKDKELATDDERTAADRARDANKQFRDELIRVRNTVDPNSALAAGLNDLIDNLQEVDGKYLAEVNLNADRARAQFDSFEAEVLRNPIEVPIRFESLNRRDIALATRGTFGAAEGFFGTLNQATPFVAGEAGSEDVLIVPTALGGIAKVVSDLASQLGESTTRSAGQQASGGVVIGPGAIQVVAGPDASPQAIAREVIDRLGYEMTVRGDG